MADDLYQYFRIEAREILERLGAGILELESGEPAPELVGRLLRDAHTLKGAARVVRQTEIAEDAHAVEDALGDHRAPGRPVPREAISRLLALLDGMNAAVMVLDAPAPQAVPVQPEAPPVDPIPVPRAEPAELNELLDAVAELATELLAARRGAGELGGLRHTVSLLTQQLPTGSAAGGLARSISTDLRSALVGIDRQLATTLDRADRELRHVQAVAERLRLTRADTIFTPLRRAARDVADAQGKEIAFTGRGGEVRLDARVLAVVHTALLHVVRNAVAHGIERPQARLADGKPGRGEVVLEVVRRGTRVSFACSDDGSGFDLDAVRRTAESRGLSAPGADPGELLEVLLRGGISTSDAVTAVSGRGIGLDVLRDVAAQLGGVVDIRTDPGRGATVELVVPLSMVAMDGFVVSSLGRTLAIPLDCVRSSMRVQPEQIVRSPQGDRILVDERMIPFLPLEHALAGGSGAARTNGAWSALILEGRDGHAAVGVDRLVGTAPIVLRPLPELAPECAVVAGATLDADGSPRLVLDPDGLVGAVRNAPPAPAATDSRPAPILVVDDSLTTRMLERSILESAGYEVDVVACGEDALVQLKQLRYGLILVDVEMPGIDGFTLVERIRADPELHDIPAILVTSRNSPEDRLRGEQVGAQAYVVKGEFDQDVLLGHIRTLMGRP